MGKKDQIEVEWNEYLWTQVSYVDAEATWQ